MKSLCPFAKAARPDDSSGTVTSNMKSACPFAKAAQPDDGSSKRMDEEAQNKTSGELEKEYISDSSVCAKVEPKCPYGFDSHTFKLGPLSCLICQALMFDSTKCVPCTHVFCKFCISRFKDCPLCGADIEKIEPNAELQEVVNRFIDGHARIKRSHVSGDGNEGKDENKPVIYEDVSLERGAFLVQQAMRAFRAQNIESAKSRLSLCAEDIREQLEEAADKPDLCSQLGAVLGMLGDCCRATGDAASAIAYFEESVKFLSQLPNVDAEIAHTLSVSLNKIGDLKYYDGDLGTARSQYVRSLVVRRNDMKNHPNVPSQVLDVAVSLAKVADVDRAMGNEQSALSGFQEAINLLESLTLDADDVALEQRRTSVLEFLNSQVSDKEQQADAQS